MTFRSSLSRYGQVVMPLRDVVLPSIAFLLAVLLSPSFITMLFLVVGQAHFFMTFLYQYRGKKMNRRYLTIAALLTVCTLSYFVFMGQFIPVFLLAGTVFGVHFSIDEFFLHKETIGPREASTIFGYLFFYASIIMQVLGPGYEMLPIFASIFVFSGMIVRLISRSWPSPAERYLWFVEALLFILAVVFGLWVQVLGVIILLHCSNWVVAYGQKVYGHPTREMRYWIDTFITLGLSSMMYAFWVIGHVGLFGLLFAPTYWYAWTIVHFLLTSTVVLGVKRVVV